MSKEQKPGNCLWIAVAVCIFLTGLVWLVFGRTLGFGFLNYDDDAYVYNNPLVASGVTLRGLKWAFTHSHAFNWHPLTTISHMLDCQLFGLNAGGAHFVNGLLHTIAVLLLFLVLWQMTADPSSPQGESVRSADRTGSIWASAFVAAIFAIHPLRVESVAWISERKDVLSGVFFMITLAAYSYYVRRPTVGRYITMSILYALGLMAKPMLVSLPFVLLLLDYWPLDRRQRSEVGGRKSEVSLPSQPRSTTSATAVSGQWSVVSSLLLEKIPLLVLAGASSVITLIVQSRTMHQIKDLPFPVRLSNAFLTYLTYIWQMFWPEKLAAFYPYASRGRLAVSVAIVFVIAVTVRVLVTRRTYPYLVTGWFWYLVMLLPAIGLVQVGVQSHADRYTYLPQIGLYLSVTWLIADFSKRWRYRSQLLSVNAAAVLAVLSWTAREQTRYWRDDGTLWRHALAVTDNNFVAHNNLAVFLGMGDDSIPELEEALREQPDYAGAHYNLARCLARKGETDNAIEHFLKTLALQPYDAPAWDGLGDAFLRKGKAREAISCYERALKIAPELRTSLGGLAWILATCPDSSLRDGARAIQLSTMAVELSKRQDPIVLRALAAAYAETGRFDQATAVARQALQLALTQSKSDLANRLRLEIDLYQINLPFRDLALTTSRPSS
jgi:tetratricopeptide (TPR) repeat protein